MAAHIKEKYGVDTSVTLEKPPKLEMGEAASPVCFELAKKLKRAPRQIAQEIAVRLPKMEGVSRVEVAGAGYLNVFFDRGAFWSSAFDAPAAKGLHRDFNAPIKSGQAPGTENTEKNKVIVEHTSINPNKAAHIGHMRNAVLGDTIARILRNAGERVQVQNYIDNTGVQVADVVIGFLHMEKKGVADVRAMAAQPGFDYLCWDLYARVTQFYEQDKAQGATLRGATLRAIEEGHGEAAEMGTIIADAIVGFHLRTMKRLGIAYELLARESEILHLKFWDAAFRKLKEAGAIELAANRKMAGCWVMRAEKEVEEVKEVKEVKEKGSTDDADDEASEDDRQDKIIVRSNGTVTYVGKDIAYQLWKFGLLGKDFHYAKWPDVPAGEDVWATTSEAGGKPAPPFGAPAQRVYNVIDTLQAYVQAVVAKGLRGFGHAEAAANLVHFSFERV